MRAARLPPLASRCPEMRRQAPHPTPPPTGEALKLRGAGDPSMSETRRNKFLQSMAARKAGLPVAAQKLAKTLEEVDQFLVAERDVRRYITVTLPSHFRPVSREAERELRRRVSAGVRVRIRAQVRVLARATKQADK